MPAQAHLQRQSAQARGAGPRRLDQLLPQVRELRQPAALHLVHVTPHLRRGSRGSTCLAFGVPINLSRWRMTGQETSAAAEVCYCKQ